MEILAALLAIGASFSWGVDQVLGKIAIRDMDTFSFNALRPAFALIFIIPTAFLLDGLVWPRTNLAILAIFSGFFAEFVGVNIYFYVMDKSAAHRVIPLGNSNPLWAATAAIIFLGEEAQPVIFISIALVILGTYLIGSREKEDESNAWIGGIMLALTAGLLWGLSAPVSKYCLNEGMNQLTLQTLRISTAAIACSSAMLFYRGKKNLNIGKTGIKIGLLSGFFAFFLGFLLWLGALGMEPASVVSPFQGGKILFGFLLSILIIGEKPSRKAFLGTGLILLGVLMVTLWG